MTAPNGELWFLSSCIELYKEKKGMSGQDAFNHLRRTDALQFILDCWEGLHITGPEYIIASIDEYIRRRSH